MSERGLAEVAGGMEEEMSKQIVCSACGGELYQRDDDTVKTVTNRLDVYESSTAPLIAYYGDKGLLRSVDGNRSVDDVFADVRAALEG